jgi:hypothetical protein
VEALPKKERQDERPRPLLNANVLFCRFCFNLTLCMTKLRSGYSSCLFLTLRISIMHPIRQSVNSLHRVRFTLGLGQLAPATVNQHPPAFNLTLCMTKLRVLELSFPDFPDIFIMHPIRQSVNSWDRVRFRLGLGQLAPATVNQHPPAQHEGWMVSGQETVFCWVPVP